MTSKANGQNTSLAAMHSVAALKTEIMVIHEEPWAKREQVKVALAQSKEIGHS